MECKMKMCIWNAVNTAKSHEQTPTIQLRERQQRIQHPLFGSSFVHNAIDREGEDGQHAMCRNSLAALLSSGVAGVTSIDASVVFCDHLCIYIFMFYYA